MDARIAYRGPDGHGVFRDQVEMQTREGTRRVDVALVHRRLAIIDPEGGHQPMVSERGRNEGEGLVAVVFNGCIYNHRELRAELERAGRRFRTDHSDTEVLIHAYREWGPGFEQRLEGMYALGLWDRTQARLVLARDRFGEKPLFVHSALDGAGPEQMIAFASDARALVSFPSGVEPSARRLTRWAETYLQLGYNWQGATVYGGFERGGEPMVVSAVRPTMAQRAEELIPARPQREIDEDAVEALLESSVKARLEADVPLGCFLSGGVDSSLVALLAARHVEGLQTYCVRMPDERYDESAYAAEVAEQIGTKHHTLECEAQPAEDLIRLIETLGQPFGDSSVLPAYWVSRAARQHVKVALSGDGGDELFLGYDRYRYARALLRHRRVLRWIPKGWGLGAHPKSRRSKLGRLGTMARDVPATGVLAMESVFSQAQIAQLLGRAPVEPASHPPGRDPMLALRSIDLQSYLPDDLLVKTDLASMSVGLEVRAPFLDRALVEAAVNAPTWCLMRGAQRKGLLRNVAAQYLPRSLVDRPKMGFAVPIGEWFRSDYGGLRTLLTDQLFSAEAFGPLPIIESAVRRRVEEHLDGRAEHGQRLFALLTLSLWARQG